MTSCAVIIMLTLLTCSYSSVVCDIVFCYWNDKKHDNDGAFHGHREMNYWYQFKMNLATVDVCMDMKQPHCSNLNHHLPTDWFLSRNDLDAAERYKVHQRVRLQKITQHYVEYGLGLKSEKNDKFKVWQRLFKDEEWNICTLYWGMGVQIQVVS